MKPAIWKYKIPPMSVPMPVGAKVLHVGAQDGEVMLWAMVDPCAPTEERHFRIYATGEPIDDGHQTYIGTAAGRLWALHVFEVVQ